MKTSRTTLSVILPVRDEAESLSTRVTELLEIVPEMSSDFEILIVDCGSTDQTEEMAHELARRYPQLRVVRHIDCSTPDALLQLGLDCTDSQVLLVFDRGAPIRARHLQEVWRGREDSRRNPAELDRRMQPPLGRRPRDWPRQQPCDTLTQAAGFQFFSRHSLGDLRSPARFEAPPSHRPRRAASQRRERNPVS